MIVFTKCTCKTDNTWDPSYTSEQVISFKRWANKKHQCEFRLLRKSGNNDKQYHCCKCNQRLRIINGKKYFTKLYPIRHKKINLRRDKL